MRVSDFRTGLCAAFLGCSAALAGPLTPPAGPIAPTPGPEPRIPISATTTPGDADSTFRIAAPGSYYLTGNVIGEAAKKGIEIFGGGGQITIDLNGFTMTGTGATSTQAGIYIDGANTTVVIRNGHIRSWNNAVLHFIGGQVVMEDVHAHGSNQIQFEIRRGVFTRCSVTNGGSHGFLADNGVLNECTAINNDGNGFTVSAAASSFRGCVAMGNTFGGFSCGQGVVSDCRSEGNGTTGFSSPGVLEHSTALGNGSDGVIASFAAVVRGCNSTGNGGDGMQIAGSTRVEGNTIAGNSQHGVNVTGDRNTIVGNTISGNGVTAGVFAGINIAAAGNDNTLEGNHITNMLLGGDDFGIQVLGTSNLIVRNTLSGVSTYFNITANNTSGGSSTAPSTAGAWVNITY